MNKIAGLFDLHSFHARGITGRGVNTAVLDTGVFPHRDLSKNIIYFRDEVNHRITPYDDNSHGTHVSGIICGRGIVNSKYTGMAPDSGIIPVKVLDATGHGKSGIIISGIEWIRKNIKRYNIRIVNISIGTRAGSCDEEGSALVQAVNSLWDDGLTVIVSAGNNGPGYHTITTPGISRKIITVGSCGWNTPHVRKGSSSLSGKGPTLCNILKPDIVVPGDSITGCGLYNSYTVKSGTSMSTPVVSGAAALLLSADHTVTNSRFKNLIHLCAADIGLDRFTQGYGRLDLKKLFILANPVI